jgi:hypothetical protein
VRIQPAPNAVSAAPTWWPAAIHDRCPLAPKASVASRRVGGTVAIQSSPYQTANTQSPVSEPASANGRKKSDSPRSA